MIIKQVIRYPVIKNQNSHALKVDIFDDQTCKVPKVFETFVRP